MVGLNVRGVALAGSVFDHFGIATDSIAPEEEFWKNLGYQRSSIIFEDQAQGVRGVFLEGSGPKLELLENLPGSTTLDPWLARRITVYHAAYRVKNLSHALEWARISKGIVVREPVFSEVFQSLIAFVIVGSRTMLEFISDD